MTHEPQWTTRVGLGGLFMLIVPPRWMVLAPGYRSPVGSRLVTGESPLLPRWRDILFVALRRGVALVISRVFLQVLAA